VAIADTRRHSLPDQVRVALRASAHRREIDGYCHRGTCIATPFDFDPVRAFVMALIRSVRD
jgi:hypothetical protein